MVSFQNQFLNYILFNIAFRAREREGREGESAKEKRERGSERERKEKREKEGDRRRALGENSIHLYCKN